MIVELDDRQHATVLAALRTYQQESEAGNIAPGITEIAYNGRAVQPLTVAEIGDFCEKLNCDNLRPDFASCLALHAYTQGSGNARYDAIIDSAGEKCSEGEIELDDASVISDGGERGAYVMAWIWGSYDGPEEEEEADKV